MIERGADEFINTRNMLKHGSAFGFYVLSLAILYGVTIPYTLHSGSLLLKVMFEFALAKYTVCNFVS